MNSVLPKANLNLSTVIASFSDKQKEVTMPKEYAWDFDKNDFKLKDGKFQIVEGIEALKIWVWKALKTSRATYPIYSSTYGQEIEKLVGNGLSKSLIESEAKRLTLECLKENEHILSIKNFKVSKEKDLLNISFTAVTDCGEVIIDV
ncbi:MULTISPECIES: DUF2634 domain-containing protein [Clostridium]|uniref:DUF2634 domain-containing protein n=2 Tax=Clostridium TaxID=1485 RepID=M1MDT1_9CLOT|nr:MULTISPECIES: DUF2634 domain-containing protein [Clostridium]AGF54548.1 hypothetical protein DUF2634 [Clostridium saccharoperbutylacetonicum N1-4(HMT)]MBC2478100.1 DUF2634 domain-containing protein [Clostridium beijerinckii]NRT58932.1 hypothetical protein [Clostridium saccharoperbutylacetonicum]NSB28120.1 hypothetical protein [Clostridium saccharoperbutylacetonicum]NSB41608.1 hypothetical protein [Clostridium saccharoperbutylacetonicum]